MARLFFALEIPAPVKKGLLNVAAPVAGAKWQHASQLHLTLLFLGNVDRESLPEISSALKELPLAGFELEVRGVGCFGRPETPRNVWAGVCPEPPVVALHGILKERLGHLGFHFEKRPFRPHITLARFRKQRGSVAGVLAAHREGCFGAFLVEEFVLLESTQGGSGSVYTVVERFPLANSLDETADSHQR
ncbi:RNA 2',3'-cyclic phosphodiesterase [Marinobacter sp. M216]|uniref:RNA 2',3'-cyclic phosphodiesterase n=1 Tax=Marinobacter albus TaxID=3030833 RepID=A0ABT7HH18_9GAMM|nr:MULTISPECIES: RNA 2',3'-cyclic phosphodiesterase [unclassified Marinobacter]MBW7472639.1 RNA 2',3'-cyclic phosphodiesterase [Marinobacter sp. F4218]MDK9559192.1 RNA 2',3'-cyclic phosphodiesterase [Marinobacter sp. M216]